MVFTIISSVTQMTRRGVRAVIFFHAHTKSREIIPRRIWQAEVIPSSHKQIFFVKMSKFLRNVHLLHLGWGKFLLKDNQSIFYKHINIPTILGKRKGVRKKKDVYGQLVSLNLYQEFYFFYVCSLPMILFCLFKMYFYLILFYLT